MNRTTDIRGVWLIVATESAGRGVHVVVETADGAHHHAIAESWPGPVSHYVHPAGIERAPLVDPVGGPELWPA